MADKDRVFRLFSDESVASVDSSQKGFDQENRGSETVINTLQPSSKNQQGHGQKLDVFERNYQYARIYDNKRCVLKAKQDADESSQRHFKASPMPIVQSHPVQSAMPKFTVPNTPEVLKHCKRTHRT
uniref:Uncharacterized protein n=1 Tax=Anopheles culicifacies TaxID=139723 RepID=A0A182MAF3_9DIPT